MIIATFLSTALVRGDYGATVGNVYTYTVEKSEWTVKYGVNNADATGYPVEDGSFQPGTSFNVEVTAAAPISVAWTLTAGTKSMSWASRWSPSKS